MDARTKNRSRWSDEPFIGKNGKPKAAKISKTDIEIFTRLNRYRHLTPDFLAEFLKVERQWPARRMSLLARQPNKYLERPQRQLKEWSQPNYRPQVYANDDKAITELKRRNLWVDRPLFGDEKLLGHSLMVNATLASLELYSPGMVWREDIPGAGTRIPVKVSGLTKSGEFVAAEFDYQNDSHGAFGVLTTDGGVRYFSLEVELNGEVERNTLEQTSFFKKVLAVRYIAQEKLYKTVWGLPQLLTLVVCTDQHEIDRRKACIMRITGGKGLSYVLFAVVPPMEDPVRCLKPDRELYQGPWQRAGHPDFYINQP